MAGRLSERDHSSRARHALDPAPSSQHRPTGEPHPTRRRLNLIVRPNSVAPSATTEHGRRPLTKVRVASRAARLTSAPNATEGGITSRDSFDESNLSGLTARVSTARDNTEGIRVSSTVQLENHDARRREKPTLQAPRNRAQSTGRSRAGRSLLSRPRPSRRAIEKNPVNPKGQPTSRCAATPRFGTPPHNRVESPPRLLVAAEK